SRGSDVPGRLDPLSFETLVRAKPQDILGPDLAGSVVIWIPVVGVCVSKESSYFQNALSGFALAMAINAVLPHLVVSLVKHSYSPGVGTGMLFNLPLGVLLIHEQLSDRTISPVEVWRAAVLYALLLAVGAFGSLYGAHAIL